MNQANTIVQPVAVRFKLDAMMQFLAETKADGCIIEVGVYQGGSLAVLAQSGRRCYGYDTFEGMPCPTAVDYHKPGDFTSPIEVAQQNLSGFSNVTLIKGLYPDSDRVDTGPVLMAHVDVDLYLSTFQTLEHVWPKLAMGGRIYMDDVFVETCHGATLAMCQFCGIHRVIPHDNNGVFYLEKEAK